MYRDPGPLGAASFDLQHGMPEKILYLKSIFIEKTEEKMERGSEGCGREGVDIQSVQHLCPFPHPLPGATHESCFL